MPPSGRRWRPAAAAAAAAVLLAALAASTRPHRPCAEGVAACFGAAAPAGDPARLAAGVRAAAATARPDAVRWSVDVPAAAAGPSDADAVPNEVAALGARASRAAADGDATALHVATLVDLLWGRLTTRALDRAPPRLEAAARLADRPAAVLTDLAATHLLRAERHPEDGRVLLLAVDAAQRALAADPRALAARFDLAVALDRAGLVTEAGREAGRYLRVDSVSRWAAAARAIAVRAAPAAVPTPVAAADTAAVAALVRADRQHAREHGWYVVLDRWAARVRARDAAGAERELALAEALGGALADAGGDASLRDETRTLRALGARPAALRRAAAAHTALADGQRRHAGADHEGAARVLAPLAADRAAPPLAASWARLLVGVSGVHGAAPLAGERLLRLVAEREDAARYPALVGRASATLGTRLLRVGSDDRARTVIARAESLLARAGERDLLGAAQLLRAVAELGEGNAPGGLAAATRALRTLAPSPHAAPRYGVLFTAARASLALGLPGVAARYHDESVDAAAGTGRPLDLAEALLARARLHVATGDHQALARDVAAAGPLVARAPLGSDRAWLEAELHLAAAAERTSDAPTLAARHAAAAAAYFRRTDNVLRLVPALAAVGTAHAAAGTSAEAVAAYREAVALVGARAARLGAPLRRSTLLAEARLVVERLVATHVARGEPRAALDALEAARAALLAGPAAPVATGGDERTLVYLRTADTLLVWTVVGDSVALRRAVLDAGFDARLARLRAALEFRRPPSAVRPLLTALYAALLGTDRAAFGPAGTPVVVVPDGSLAGVPFAALVDPTTGRHVVEDHPVRFGASLRDVRASAADASAAVPSGAVMLAADPAFDAAARPELDRLPGARQEVDDLAALYPTAERLTGAAVTRAALAGALRRAALVHYAGHALPDPVQSDRSALLLAPDPPAERPGAAGGAGLLTASDIAALPLPALRLVVLSSCETAGAAASALGVVDGIAGAFRAAGARAVVGSPWRVDDGATRAVMVAFHAALRQGADPPAALREAQLRMLRDRSPALRTPATWAGFRVVGR